MTCERCRDSGWICEAHPDQRFGHDACTEPGDPCPECQDVDHPKPPSDFSSFTDESTPFYAPNRRVGVPRQRARGVEVWRLHYDGRVQTCELRDDSRAGAGWDVQVLENDETLFSLRCAVVRGSRYVEDRFR